MTRQPDKPPVVAEQPPEIKCDDIAEYGDGTGHTVVVHKMNPGAWIRTDLMVGLDLSQ